MMMPAAADVVATKPDAAEAERRRREKADLRRAGKRWSKERTERAKAHKTAKGKPSVIDAADAKVKDAAAKRASEMLGSPIMRYLRKRYIDSTQARAGNTYLDDWHASRNTKVSQYDQDRVDGGGSAGSILDIVSRAHAFDHATCTLGPLAPLMFAICIMGLSAEYCALKSGEDRKAIMAMLRAGLDTLARHYGYAPRGYQGADWLTRLTPDKAKGERDKKKVLATSGPASL